MSKLIVILMLLFTVLPSGILLASERMTTEENFFILPQYSKRVSLDFKDADIKDVLKVFSRQIGANFVLNSSVKEMLVTVYLDNVPVEEAMREVLTANNLVYQYDAKSNIFAVTLKDAVKPTATRIYTLKYATVPASKLNSTISIGSSGSADSSSSGSSSSTESTSASTTTSGSSSSGLIAAIQASMTKDGKIAEDPRTNSLIITDTEENFAQIEKVIARLDVPITQVLIEVRMLDVSKAATDKIGINYGEGKFFSFTGTSIPTFLPFNQKTILDKGGTREFTAGSIGFSSMSAIVNFLESQSDTQSLARPRLLTLDNETAQIKISTDETIGVKIEQGSSGSSGSLTTTTAERTQTGVFLTVTPQVNILSNEITLAVAPKVIEATSSQFTNDAGDVFRDPEERGANIIMKVKAGETIMMGGLLRKRTATSSTRIPVLGSIPFLGKLFRYDSVDKTERELVIFITPHIINDAGNALSDNKGMIDVNLRENPSIDRSYIINQDMNNALNRHQRK